MPLRFYINFHIEIDSTGCNFVILYLFCWNFKSFRNLTVTISDFKSSLIMIKGKNKIPNCYIKQAGDELCQAYHLLCQVLLKIKDKSFVTNY